MDLVQHFLELTLALLVYGGLLFAIVQYFDSEYTSTLEKEKEEADRKYYVSLKQVGPLYQEIGKLWGKIRRWGHGFKRRDVVVLAMLVAVYPLTSLVYIAISIVEWDGVVVKEKEISSFLAVTFLIIYSLAFFTVACFAFWRIRRQRTSLLEFRNCITRLRDMYYLARALKGDDGLGQ